MLVIGIRCAKAALQWAVIRGRDRRDAVIVEWAEKSAPEGDRLDQLAWAADVVRDVLVRHAPDKVALRITEVSPKGNGGLAVGRAEMDGVVQVITHEGGYPLQRYYNATIRAVFKANSTMLLEAALAPSSCLQVASVSQRDPIIVGLAELERKVAVSWRPR